MSSKLTPNEMEGKNEDDRVASPVSVSTHLSLNLKCNYITLSNATTYVSLYITNWPKKSYSENQLFGIQ